jgi:hypothetical protein
MTYTQVAAGAGCTRQNIREIAEGRVPGPEVADRLGQLLDDPQLLQMATAARRISCAICGRVVFAGTFRRVYCSDDCGHIARALGRKALTERESALIRSRSGLLAAIDAMCLSCEPEGICRTAECPLRAVSPLPLSNGKVGTVPPRLTGWEDPRRKVRTAEHMRQVWATSRAERTEAIVAGIRRKRAA